MPKDTSDRGGAPRTTIVLADDHAVVRSALRMLLEAEPGFEVVAEAGDAEGAARYVRGHKPNVLVLDLNMPGRSSLEMIPTIKEASPATQIVVLTMQAETAFARQALDGHATASKHGLEDAQRDHVGVEGEHEPNLRREPSEVVALRILTVGAELSRQRADRRVEIRLLAARSGMRVGVSQPRIGAHERELVRPLRWAASEIARTLSHVPGGCLRCGGSRWRQVLGHRCVRPEDVLEERCP